MPVNQNNVVGAFASEENNIAGFPSVGETKNNKRETSAIFKNKSLLSKDVLKNPFFNIHKGTSPIKKDKIAKKVEFNDNNSDNWDYNDTTLTNNMNSSGVVFHQLKNVICSIRNFNATSGKSTAQFISDIEDASKYIPTSHHKEFIKCLREKLVDPRAQNIDLASFNTVKEFTDYLDRNFGHNKTAILLMADLSQLSQDENESVYEYYE
uniref:Uncharacterized protein n=1 Tax=Trichogramma kaykai TaxID=54128 RepID=A0ABD2WS75_9HYME